GELPLKRSDVAIRSSAAKQRSGVERISAAAESNKRQRTADDRHILHEVLELIQIVKVRVPDLSSGRSLFVRILMFVRPYAAARERISRASSDPGRPSPLS